MGNNPNKEVQTSRRFSGLGLAQDERTATPEKLGTSRRDHMIGGLRDGGQRAKSMNQDNSFQRLIASSATGSRQAELTSKAFDEVKKAENFCNHFVNETLKIKLNANLSQCAHLISVLDKKQAGPRTQRYASLTQLQQVQLHREEARRAVQVAAASAPARAGRRSLRDHRDRDQEVPHRTSPPQPRSLLRRVAHAHLHEQTDAAQTPRLQHAFPPLPDLLHRHRRKPTLRTRHQKLHAIQQRQELRRRQQVRPALQPHAQLRRLRTELLHERPQQR